ncbi:MAG: protein translocase subunit SecD, partial [Chthoniobacterales bacterium]|nr:protein translocase subunit SecD [Chthoniobacterales bacterium]
MSPAITFFIGIVLLVLFGWYFATDFGPRKRLLATLLMALLVAFSIVTIWPPSKKIQLGLDIQGGTSFLIRLVPAQGDKALTKNNLEQAVEVIRKRVDYFGGGEPVISPVGSDRILVQIPGLDPAKIIEARQQLSRVAKLEFRLVYPDNGERLRSIDAGTEVIPPEYRIETYKMQAEEGQKPVEERLLVKKKADLGGDRVTESNAYYGNDGWTVQLKFDGEGAKKFGQITEANVGHRFAIVLDGAIQSAPSIRTAIYGGDAIITGRFGEQEARGLASVLENPLQTPVSVEEERSVSPTLGLDSIRSSIFAGLLGLAITLVFVVIYYKFAGLIANVVLIVNIILLMGALTMFNFVLTLPGIAGIILTIGLAVDASVLIYERLREELALGKSLKVALQTAYEKAFSSILDANVTTLITAAILFWKASGPIKGFAISLTLGILASLFTALIVGRNLFGWFVDTEKVKRVSMLHLISPKHINFLSKGFLAAMLSLALLIAGGTAFVIRGDRNFGVDFKGGDLLSLSAAKTVQVAQVREALKPIGLDNEPIQQSLEGERNFITIRSPINTSDKINTAVREHIPNGEFKVEREERVGALVHEPLAGAHVVDDEQLVGVAVA